MWRIQALGRRWCPLLGYPDDSLQPCDVCNQWALFIGSQTSPESYSPVWGCASLYLEALAVRTHVLRPLPGHDSFHAAVLDRVELHP